VAVTFDSAVLCAAVVGELLVCGLLIRRKIWRTLPSFCVYALWTLASDVAGSVILWKFPASYKDYYYDQTIADSIFQFAVLGELGWSVLKPVRSSLPRASRAILYGLIAVAGFAIWPFAAIAAPQSLTGHTAILFHLQETFSILRVVCFLIMASFSQLLSIGWRDRELQVATGLGFFSVASLLVTVLHSHQVWSPQYHQLDQALSLSYVGTMTYWVISFATKEQERKEFSPQMQQLLVLMSGGARTGRIALGDLPPEPSRKRIK
jgi:hypothetical protein